MSGAAPIRRQTRLRKEYLYRKSLEGKDKAAYERKRLIRTALQGACMDGWMIACDDDMRHWMHSRLI